MTQIEIKPTTAEKLQELSKKAQKSVDEILLLLLNQFGHTVIETDDTNDEDVIWTEEGIVKLFKEESHGPTQTHQSKIVRQ